MVCWNSRQNVPSPRRTAGCGTISPEFPESGFFQLVELPECPYSNASCCACANARRSARSNDLPIPLPITAPSIVPTRDSNQLAATVADERSGKSSKSGTNYGTNLFLGDLSTAGHQHRRQGKRQQPHEMLLHDLLLFRIQTEIPRHRSVRAFQRTRRTSRWQVPYLHDGQNGISSSSGSGMLPSNSPAPESAPLPFLPLRGIR